MIEVAIGRREIAEAGTVELAETAQMDLRVRNAESMPDVSIGGEPVPLVAESVNGAWCADPDWVHSAATQHLVGDCDLVVEVQDQRWSALLRRAPSRITLSEYRFLVGEIRRRSGLDGLDDPFARAAIWLEAAPEVPSDDDEAARIATQLFRRAAHALGRIAHQPMQNLETSSEWVDVERLGAYPGHRVDPRRLRPWDPPRPMPHPNDGAVLVALVDEHIVTPENRFVLATVERLTRVLERSTGMPTSRSKIDADAALRQLTDWFATEPWTSVPPGRAPGSSFVLRDHPDYRAVAALARQLDDLPGLLLRFPPTNIDDAFPLNPWSLNVLYERWIAVITLEWLEHQVGPISRPRVPARGSYRARARSAEVVVRIDEPYPRSETSGVIVPLDKNRPDVAIELHTRDHPIAVCVVEATYSRNPALQREKLKYAGTLVDAGSIRSLTNRPAVCCEWACVAFPGGVPSVTELRAGLRESLVSIPPSPDGAAMLHGWLDETIGERLRDR